MKFKKFKPFVLDAVSMLLILAIIFLCFFSLGYVSIKFNLLTVMSLIVLAFYFVRILYNTIVLGIKAIIDFLFKKNIKVYATYIESIPLLHSSVSEKITKDFKKVIPLYYHIVIETNDRKMYVISSEYVELEKGEMYNFQMGYFSKVLLNVE